MSTPIISTDVFLFMKAASDNDAAYKAVICPTDITYDGSNDLNSLKTWCGVITTPSVSADTFSFNGAIAIDLNASTEISSQQLQVWRVSRTLCSLKLEFPTTGSVGASFFREASVYIGKVSETFNADGTPAKFSCSLTVTGIVDLVA